MIQILSTLPAGTEQNPLVAPSGAVTAASFMSLFAQALTQGVTEDKAGNPVLSSLPGHRGLKAVISDGGQAAGAKPLGHASTNEAAGGDATAGAAASFLSMLTLPASVPGIEPAGKAVEVAKGKAVATAGAVPEVAAGTVAGVLAGAAPETPAEVVSEVVAGFVPGVEAGAVTVPMTADADKAVQASVQGTVSETAAALMIDADKGRSGKKLPNPRAVIAGQQKTDLIHTQLDLSKVEQSKSAPLVSGALPDDPKLPALSVLPASQAVAAPAATMDAVATPVSGQEASLMAIRGHAEAGQSGKVVIGMQNGFGTPAWQQEMGDKVVWLAGRHGQMAELVLNPPSLGAVEVRLNMSGQDATAQFFSANPHVRDAIEAALPRLRELMVGAGISLGEATVSDQSFGQRDKAEQGRSTGQAGFSALTSTEDGLSVQTVRMTGTSLLDYFV